MDDHFLSTGPKRKLLVHGLDGFSAPTPSWPAPHGSGGIPRSGSLLPDEGPEQPCPLESPLVQAAGASRSTFVAPVLVAIAAGSPAGRRSVPGEQPTAVGLIQRALPDPLVAEPGGPLGGARRQPRDGAWPLQRPGHVAHPERDGPTEACGRRQRRGRGVPRSVFVARITPTKVQVDGPDDVFGTYRSPSSSRTERSRACL